MLKYDNHSKLWENSSNEETGEEVGRAANITGKRFNGQHNLGRAGGVGPSMSTKIFIYSPPTPTGAGH